MSPSARRRRACAWSALLIALAGCSGEPFEGGSSCAVALPLFNASTDSGALAVSETQARAIAALRSEADQPVQCSATLIGDGFGVTAAHCAHQQLLELRLPDATRNVPIRWVDTHPELDVALFELEGDEPDASELEPIPFFAGTIDDSFVGERLTLAGLGQTESGGIGELRFVDEQVMQITDTEIWVDGMGETGACGGDSGGPILVRDGEGELRIAGVLDRGSPNCLGLDVYTRADRIRDWAAKQGVPGSGGPHGACSGLR